MEILEKIISENDISFLKKSFLFTKIDYFKESILKLKIESALYFSFPFKSSKNEDLTFQILNINYSKKIGSNNFSFWIHELNKGVNYEYVFLSDNPVSIIKYFSKNFSTYQKSKIVCIVPFKVNNNTLTYIKENYKANNVITIFDNQNTKELLKLKTSFIYSDKILNAKKVNNKYHLSYNQKEIIVENISCTYLKTRFNISNFVKHKSV